MPNDAKLGLLTGVLGVIVVAALSAQRPPQPAAVTATPPATPAKTPEPPTSESPVPEPHPAAVESPPEPEVLPAELPSTPVVRTRKEPDARPTSRTRNDDDIDP